MMLRMSADSLEEALAEALGVLIKGGIVAYPTETFYALGVKFDLADSLERLYVLKNRPREKSMPLIIGDAGLLGLIAAHTPGQAAKALMSRFWPGPLTLILEASQGLSDFIVAENRVAVRTPGASFALKLAQTASFPITATSANPSGRPPADTADMVQAYFGSGIDLLIDGGKTPGGLPSTIADATSDQVRVLRQGVVKID